MDEDGNAMEETCLTEGANANAVDEDVAINEEAIIKLVVVRLSLMRRCALSTAAATGDRDMYRGHRMT